MRKLDQRPFGHIPRFRTGLPNPATDIVGARTVVLLCLIAASAFCLMSCSCMFVLAVPRQVDISAKRITTTSPIKAHMYDGSVVVFPKGVQTRKGILNGEGIRYDMVRQSSWRVRGVERDSVAFLESYDGKILRLPTGLSLAGLAGSWLILTALAMASSTTVY